jgi:hypothetical protein
LIAARPPAASLRATHAIFGLLGLVGLGWGALTLPGFWYQFPADQVTSRILRNETFPLARLQDQMQAFAQRPQRLGCNAAAAHDTAVMSLSVLQQSFAAASAEIDSRIEASRRAVVAGLSCLPGDAYLWFALFQIENLQSGFNPANLGHLAMSYQVGPNEGWIAIPRNKAGFAIFPALTDELKGRVLDEFALLLQSELYNEVVDIFLGVALPYRDAVLKRLQGVPQPNRQRLAFILARMGIDGHIPGANVVVRERL